MLQIVGIGQTLDFQTKEMVDHLQVLLPSGEIISVPTTNEAAQTLIGHVMKNGASPVMRPPRPQQETWSGERRETSEQDYVVPDGASVFGGDIGDDDEDDDIGEIFSTEKEANASRRPAREPGGLGEDGGMVNVAQQRRLGVRAMADDRSGVPTRTISRVDEKGNPILPPPPEIDDEEEDPGEQI